MAISLNTPKRDGLGAALEALREWQSDDAPFQLHPGDLGWFARAGAAKTAESLRVWSRNGRIVAVGLLDGADVLRLTTAPDQAEDEELAARICDDISDAASGVLPAGEAYVETPDGVLVRQQLADRGWDADEPWTPLQRDLSAPVPASTLRIEVVDRDSAATRVEVQRAAFDNSTYTVERWQTMSDGPLFASARDLVGYDDAGHAVAAITVWSAGVGKPGLIEPMGAHRDHRGHGFGTAITLAGAAALRELGSSSVTVCTKSSNVAGVATYRAAGLTPLAERMDLARRF